MMLLAVSPIARPLRTRRRKSIGKAWHTGEFGYLTLSAKICGPPALDREFKTIDFLTLLDMETLHPLARQRFLGA